MKDRIKMPTDYNIYQHISVILFGISLILASYVWKLDFGFSPWYIFSTAGIFLISIAFWMIGSCHFKELKEEFTCPQKVIKIYNNYDTFPNIDDGIAKYFNDNGFHEISEHEGYCSHREFLIDSFIREQPNWMKDEYNKFYTRTFSNKNAFEFQFIEKVPGDNGCIMDSVVATYTCDYGTLRKKFTKR